MTITLIAVLAWIPLGVAALYLHRRDRREAARHGARIRWIVRLPTRSGARVHLYPKPRRIGVKSGYPS